MEKRNWTKRSIEEYKIGDKYEMHNGYNSTIELEYGLTMWSLDKCKCEQASWGGRIK